MLAARSVDVEAYKEGKFWMILIPELDALTQARTVAAVPGMAADLAAIKLGIDKDDVDIHVTYRLPADAAQANKAWHQSVRQAAEARAAADAKLSELAHILKVNDYTLKDIAAVTGYTFQRISQVLNR